MIKVSFLTDFPFLLFLIVIFSLLIFFSGLFLAAKYWDRMDNYCYTGHNPSLSLSYITPLLSLPPSFPLSLPLLLLKHSSSISSTRFPSLSFPLSLSFLSLSPFFCYVTHLPTNKSDNDEVK